MTMYGERASGSEGLLGVPAENLMEMDEDDDIQIIHPTFPSSTSHRTRRKRMKFKADRFDPLVLSSSVVNYGRAQTSSEAFRVATSSAVFDNRASPGFNYDDGQSAATSSAYSTQQILESEVPIPAELLMCADEVAARAQPAVLAESVGEELEYPIEIDSEEFERRKLIVEMQLERHSVRRLLVGIPEPVIKMYVRKCCNENRSVGALLRDLVGWKTFRNMPVWQDAGRRRHQQMTRERLIAKFLQSSPAAAPRPPCPPVVTTQLPPTTRLPPTTQLPPTARLPPTTQLPLTTQLPPTARLPSTTQLPPTARLPPTTQLPPTTRLPPTTLLPPTTQLPPTTLLPPTTQLPPVVTIPRLAPAPSADEGKVRAADEADNSETSGQRRDAPLTRVTRARAKAKERAEKANKDASLSSPIYHSLCDQPLDELDSALEECYKHVMGHLSAMVMEWEPAAFEKALQEAENPSSEPLKDSECNLESSAAATQDSADDKQSQPSESGKLGIDSKYYADMYSPAAMCHCVRARAHKLSFTARECLVLVLQACMDQILAIGGINLDRAVYEEPSLFADVDAVWREGIRTMIRKRPPLVAEELGGLDDVDWWGRGDGEGDNSRDSTTTNSDCAEDSSEEATTSVVATVAGSDDDDDLSFLNGCWVGQASAVSVGSSALRRKLMCVELPAYDRECEPRRKKLLERTRKLEALLRLARIVSLLAHDAEVRSNKKAIEEKAMRRQAASERLRAAKLRFKKEFGDPSEKAPPPKMTRDDDNSSAALKRKLKKERKKRKDTDKNEKRRRKKAKMGRDDCARTVPFKNAISDARSMSTEPNVYPLLIDIKNCESVAEERGEPGTTNSFSENLWGAEVDVDDEESCPYELLESGVVQSPLVDFDDCTTDTDPQSNGEGGGLLPTAEFYIKSEMNTFDESVSN